MQLSQVDGKVHQPPPHLPQPTISQLTPRLDSTMEVLDNQPTTTQPTHTQLPMPGAMDLSSLTLKLVLVNGGKSK
jgi:hypothetical protein